MTPRVRGIKRDAWIADGRDPEEDYRNNENFEPTSFEVKIAKSNIDESPDTTKLALLKTLRSCVSGAIAKLCNNISWRFAHAGKFVYPGYGDLDFKNPRFTKSGNIVAEIDFKYASICLIFFCPSRTRQLISRPSSRPPRSQAVATAEC